MSQWTKSKTKLVIWFWLGKTYLLCLVRGQMGQEKTSYLLQCEISGTIDFNNSSLWEEGCPSLQCHRLESPRVDVLLQDAKKEESTWELASKGETNFDRRDEIQVGKTTWDELQGIKITMLLTQPNHPPML